MKWVWKFKTSKNFMLSLVDWITFWNLPGRSRNLTRSQYQESGWFVKLEWERESYYWFFPFSVIFLLSLSLFLLLSLPQREQNVLILVMLYHHHSPKVSEIFMLAHIPRPQADISSSSLFCPSLTITKYHWARSGKSHKQPQQISHFLLFTFFNSNLQTPSSHSNSQRQTFSFSWSKSGWMLWIRRLSLHDTEMNFHSPREHRNIVLETGQMRSRLNKPYRTAGSAQIWSVTSDCRRTCRRELQSLNSSWVESRALRKVITPPLLLKCNQPGCGAANRSAGCDLCQPFGSLCCESLPHHSSAGRKGDNLDCFHSII